MEDFKIKTDYNSWISITVY